MCGQRCARYPPVPMWCRTEGFVGEVPGRSCCPTLRSDTKQGGDGPRCHFFSSFFANKLYKDTVRVHGGTHVCMRLFLGGDLPAPPARASALPALPALHGAKLVTLCPPHTHTHLRPPGPGRATTMGRCGAGRCPGGSRALASSATACWTATSS